MNRRDPQAHTHHLEYLLHHPKRIGIEQPIIWAAKEVLLYKPTYPDMETDIDLMYRTPSDIWVAEYKCSPGHSRDARRQLDIIREHVKEYHGTTPRTLYVAGPKYLWTEFK